MGFTEMVNETLKTHRANIVANMCAMEGLWNKWNRMVEMERWRPGKPFWAAQQRWASLSRHDLRWFLDDVWGFARP